MRSPITLIGAAAALALAHLVSASTFVGCISFLTLPSGSFSSSSLSGCESSCSKAGYEYSYFFALGGLCACDNTGPASTIMASSGLAYAGCPITTLGGVQVSRLVGTFSFDVCAISGSVLYTSALTIGLVSTIEQCLDSCVAYRYATYDPDTLLFSSLYTCTCSQDIAFALASTCAQGFTYIFSHTPGATAAGGYAKRLLKARAEQLLLDTQLCPAGMEACVVPGSPESYECINTADELESCGGCVHGVFSRGGANAENATVQGTDCTSASGVALGGVTCNSGTCDVTACKRGWVLRGGACVRRSGGFA